jgi:hypothetical protein
MNYAGVYLIILLSCAGCITASYQRSNDAYSHSRREFTPQFNNNTMIIKGQWAEEVDYRGGRCRRLQFDNVLKGDGRFFDVMIPLEAYRMKGYHGTWPYGRNESEDLPVHQGLPFFTESDRKTNGGHPAYLILHDPTHVDTELFNAFFNLKVGGTADPNGLMKKHFNYVITDAAYPLAVVKLEIQGQDRYREHDRFGAHAVLWDRTPDGKTVITAYSSVSDEFHGDHMDIRWKERNKPLFVIRQAGYVGTAIADIITSPVQLVWMVLSAMGGGVR